MRPGLTGRGYPTQTRWFAVSNYFNYLTDMKLKLIIKLITQLQPVYHLNHLASEALEHSSSM